jgi:hypothetical protein
MLTYSAVRRVQPAPEVRASGSTSVEEDLVDTLEHLSFQPDGSVRYVNQSYWAAIRQVVSIALYRTIFE